MKIVPFIYPDEDDLIANTYIAVDNNKCVIIDPSKDYDGLIKFIKKNDLEPKAILLTHGHFDHMRGINVLLDAFHLPLYIGFYDQDNLIDGRKNLSSLFSNKPCVINCSPITISNGDKIRVLSEDIEVIETPFHTEGSVCYYLKDSKILFSGDTLFKNSIGRDDLPGACPKKKKASLERIMQLPDDVKVYPGHGEFTNIGNEKKYNPFVNY